MVKVREFIKELQTYNVGGRSELSSDWECFDWNEYENSIEPIKRSL